MEAIAFNLVLSKMFGQFSSPQPGISLSSYYSELLKVAEYRRRRVKKNPSIAASIVYAPIGAY